MCPDADNDRYGQLASLILRTCIPDSPSGASLAPPPRTHFSPYVHPPEGAHHELARSGPPGQVSFRSRH